jgi:septal ring factor EnvC (AmiA/AmiB activator)
MRRPEDLWASTTATGFGRGRERRERGRRRSQQAWWKKALIGAAITVVSVSALMAVRLWIVDGAIDRAQRHAIETSSKMQQQIHASTQRTLAEQQKQREARQVLE